MVVIDVGLLEGKPSASVFHEVLKGLDERDELLSLVETLTIIKTVVPIWPSLRKESINVLLDLLSSNFSFIAQLVTFTSSLPEMQAEKKIYQSLIVELIVSRNQCLLNYVGQCLVSKVLWNDLKAVLFGSKLFNVISVETDIVDYLKYLREHWRYVLANMPGTDLERCGNQLGELLITMLTLNPVLTRAVMIEEFLLATKDSFQSLKTIIFNSTSLNRQRLLKNLIFPFLDLKTTRHNYRSVYSILKELAVENLLDASYVLRLDSLVLIECIVRLLSARALGKLLSLLLQMFIKVDTTSDEKVCQVIVMALKSQSPESNSRIGTDGEFLNGVTTRLMNKDSLVRERTMFVAKVVSQGDLQYDSDFVIEIPDLNLSGDNAAIDFSSLNTTQYPLDVPSLPPSKALNNSFSVDSDDDDEDDEKKREIVFLKDLVIEFAGLDNKKSKSPLSLLKLTVKLVRQKKSFTNEVSYYSTALLSNIACLNNNLDESHFEQGRINALVSILVVTPKAVTELLRIFFTSELSLQQKMSILSSLGLSARELRGFDDESIAKPQFDFPTSRLPWDKPKDASTESRQLVFEQAMTMQKVVWKSKKLATVNEKQPARNQFRQFAGLFFYPLAHAWLEGINLGTFDELFKSHYLMTLHILYHCADPVHDYDSITELMKEIVIDASHQGIKI